MNPKLIPEEEGDAFEVDRDLVVVGRSRKCDLSIRKKSVSTIHCVIGRFGDHLSVVDMGSTNGIGINGKRKLRGELQHRDVLRIADLKYRVQMPQDDGEALASVRTIHRTVAGRDDFANFENQPIVVDHWRPGMEVFAGCTLGETLGEGGFGKVWRAKLEGFGEFALKWIQISDPIRNEERALRLMKGLRHKHLIRVYGARRQEDVLVVAMELGSETLLHRFARCQFHNLPGIPLDEMLGYVRQVAEALDYLYFTRKVLHRDIKPSNVLVAGNVAKVCDIGLAKVLENEVGFHSGIASFDFAPPEFFEEKMAASSDQFSLAVTFVFLLTGQKPFPGTDPRQVMIAHLTGKPKLEKVPSNMQPVLAKALKKNPAERFESCSHFALALRRAAGRTA